MKFCENKEEKKLQLILDSIVEAIGRFMKFEFTLI